MIEPNDIFVGRALALGRRAPAALEIGAVPDREYGVGVVGIDDEEHAASFTRPGRLHQRRSAGIPPRSRVIDFLRDLDRESGRTTREHRAGPGSAPRPRAPPPPATQPRPAPTL